MLGDRLAPTPTNMEEESELRWRCLGSGIDAALGALDRMRLSEGAALAVDLGARVTRLRELSAEIRQRAPEVQKLAGERLRERLTRLLQSAEGATLEALSLEGRLLQELALLADRSDISEELTRIESHASQLLERLSSGAPAGRAIDFLLQELSREVNTIGSKSQDAQLARRVVELKAELEKMREQAQNLE